MMMIIIRMMMIIRMIMMINQLLITIQVTAIRLAYILLVILSFGLV